MKVDFSTVHPCRIGWPERVRIKNSPAARRAYATRLHLAEIRTEGLCADCAHVKARIHVRITQQPADGDTSKPTEQCMHSIPGRSVWASPFLGFRRLSAALSIGSLLGKGLRRGGELPLERSQAAVSRYWAEP